MEGIELFCHYFVSVVYRVTRVMNTYAWMKATADSKIERVKETGVVRMFVKILRFERAFPNKVISK